MKMQQLYRSNVVSLMKNIWHRGAISIIKKFKFLRRLDCPYGKWTLGGTQKRMLRINQNIHYYYLKRFQKIIERN